MTDEKQDTETQPGQAETVEQQAPIPMPLEPALADITIVITGPGGVPVPAGAFKITLEKLGPHDDQKGDVVMGWKNIHDCRYKDAGLLVQLLRGRRLVIEMIGDI